ncbi:M20/M25/M40 family metallo-hydrolase [Dasania marina]|uniref:M20/M25/M40 family metallo-hydrolase n=1 Tax=Dasania marina TaxID=471499 RepID=UPI0030DA2A52
MNASVSKAKEQVHHIFDEVRADIEHYFTQIWQCAELPCLEFESVRLLGEWLQKEGFTLERNLSGVPTAFAATWGQGGSTVGFFAEYDALPGVDNAATPYRKPLGNRAGHGCGHNHIGAANIGAAIVAKRYLERNNLPGSIRVIGCPAEEIVWGKVAVLERGGIGKPDVLLTSHGDYQNGAMSRPCQSVFSGEVRFYGDSGHAGISSQCSAMEALQTAMQSITRAQHEHFPDATIRSIIRRGGDCPTVVPSEAGIWFSTRSDVYSRAQDAYDFVMEVCGRVAEENNLGLKREYISASHGYLPNDTLGELLYRNMEIVGPPQWSAEDVAWQQELVKAVRPNGEFSLDRSIAYYQEGVDYYGQDDGEVSWHIPLGRVNWAVPEEVPIHHWSYTALSGHKAGFAGPLMASESLALAAVELFHDSNLIDLAKAELQQRNKGQIPAPPKVGAFDALAQTPELFWDGSWMDEM